MLCMGLSDIRQCEIIAFYITFCPCLILSLFNLQISPPVESVYCFHRVFPGHIIFPLLCGLDLGWIFLLFWTLICTLCNHTVQWPALWIVSLVKCGTGLAISRQRFWHRSVLTEQWEESAEERHEDNGLKSVPGRICRGIECILL